MKKIITKEDIINNVHNYKIQQIKDARLKVLLKNGFKRASLCSLFILLVAFLHPGWEGGLPTS